MGKHIYSMKCCNHEKWLSPCPNVQNHHVSIGANISIQMLFRWTSSTQTHTVQPLINGGKDQQESHYREKEYRGGSVLKKLPGDKYTTSFFFLYNGLYVHIKLVWSPKNNNKKLSGENMNQWNMIRPFQFSSLLSAYVFIQNRLSNNIWVVQSFCVDSSWLITFTNSLCMKKTESYPIHSITQSDQRHVKKK